MVGQVCSYMEAERGYQNVRKYQNLMRTQVGTFVTISTYDCFTCMQLVSGIIYFQSKSLTGVIGSDVPWLDCPACNALTWVITVTE